MYVNWIDTKVKVEKQICWFVIGLCYDGNSQNDMVSKA